jgi:hypothetical protein
MAKSGLEGLQSNLEAYSGKWGKEEMSLLAEALFSGALLNRTI